MNLDSASSSVDFSMLSVTTPSIALTFSNRDRVIYVFAKTGFLNAHPIFYLDVKNFYTLDKTKRAKKEIDPVALRLAVAEQATELFEAFYMMTDEDKDFLVSRQWKKGEPERRSHCNPIEGRIIPMEVFFESEDRL